MLELTYCLSVRIIPPGPTVVAAVVAEHVQMAMRDDEHGIGLVLDPETLVVEAMLPGNFPTHPGPTYSPHGVSSCYSQDVQPASVDTCKSATL